MDLTEPFKRATDNIEERVRLQVEESKENLTTLNHRMAAYIRANPGICVIGAMTVGYIIGRIAQRK